MKHLLLVAVVVALSFGLAGSSLAADGKAMVRVVHASPDAPAVDVWDSR